MKNYLLIAAALVLPAAPLMAQAIVPAGHGATAGRSPHQAYKTAGAEKPGCARATMHTIPAGKLPTYGTHAFPAAGCTDPQVASTTEPSRARD